MDSQPDDFGKRCAEDTSGAPLDGASPDDDFYDNEYYLPDLPLFTVLSHLDAASLRTCRAVSKRFLEMSSGDRLWRNLARATLPPRESALLESPAFAQAPTALSRYTVWDCTRSALRGKRPTAPPGVRDRDAAHAPRVHSARISHGPLFCAHALRGPTATPSVLFAGGTGTVSVVTLGPRRAGEADAAAVPDDADDKYSSFVRGRLWPSMRADAPSGCVATVAYEWAAHDGEGMLGMSVDESRHAVEGAPGPTVITCSFSGESSLWRCNFSELGRLRSLPAKRLRALLTARGVSTEGIVEREDFVRRIVATNALPAATLLARFSRHGGTVVSASHEGGLAVTSSHDGTIKIYDVSDTIEEPKTPRSSAGGGSSSGGGAPARVATPALQPVRTITAHEGGVDVVSLERGGRSLLSGGKDGRVCSWDVETGRMLWEGNCGACWVWCVRSSRSVEAAVPSWPSAAGAVDERADDGLFSNPALFLSGDTAGFVRLWDRRESGPCITSVRGSLGRVDSTILAEGDGMEAGAVAGLALNGANSFFSTGFDGVLRASLLPLRYPQPASCLTH